MSRFRTTIFAALVALAGCGSTGPADGGGGPAPADPERPARGNVSIPPHVAAELDTWIAEETALIGDVIEIDATRVPFASHFAIETTRETDATGKRLVERTDTTDPETGALTIVLTNRSGFRTTIETLPRVRLGVTRQFVARDRLVLRHLPVPGTERPVSFSAVATGDARLVGGAPGQRVTGERLRLSAEIAEGPAGYEFRSAAGK